MDPTLPFRILLTGISYCDGSYRISRMKSPLTVLEYVVKGTGSILCDGESFTASSGDVYILRKGTCHTYSSDAKDPWIKLFFNLDGSLVELLLDQYEIGNPVVLHRCPVEPLFREFIQTAFTSVPIHGAPFISAHFFSTAFSPCFTIQSPIHLLFQAKQSSCGRLWTRRCPVPSPSHSSRASAGPGLHNQTV
ncbi:MAG: AraC family ligand binding domain-containing protein [Clostridia bacterium]